MVAGDVYASRPQIFELLARRFAESIYCTIADDVMQEIAANGALGCIEVGELSCHWFGGQTVAAVFRPPPTGKKRAPTAWAGVVDAATALLYANSPSRPMPHSVGLQEHLVPLLQLGHKIGEGSNCEARGPRPPADRPWHVQTRLTLAAPSPHPRPALPSPCQVHEAEPEQRERSSTESETPSRAKRAGSNPVHAAARTIERATHLEALSGGRSGGEDVPDRPRRLGHARGHVGSSRPAGTPP